MDWRAALEETVRLAQPALEREETRWAVIGSAATALHGCDVIPNDLDLLAAHPAGVARVAELMAHLMPERCPTPVEHDAWRSSRQEPLSIGPDGGGSVWHFARWEVGGIEVEVAHIAPPPGAPIVAPGAGIWEAGPAIWPHIVTLPLGSYAVPVVPLELQVETSLGRGLEARLEAILARLRRRGYDAALLRQALRADHVALIEARLATSS